MIICGCSYYTNDTSLLHQKNAKDMMVGRGPQINKCYSSHPIIKLNMVKKLMNRFSEVISLVEVLEKQEKLNHHCNCP
jgi:hypothetical protein